MTENYPRAWNITAGTSTWFSPNPPDPDNPPLRVRFKIKQFTLQSPNEGSVTITNPSPDKALPLKQWTGLPLQINAGYIGNIGLIFQGDIKQAIYGRENATDTFLTVFAGDTDHAHNYATINKTFAPGSTPKDHVDAAVAAMSPLTIGVIGATVALATPIFPRAVVLFGMARDVLANVAKSKNANVSYQNGQLHMVGPLDTAPTAPFVLNSRTGLIGMPTQTMTGILARALINPQLKVNSQVKIDQADIAQMQQPLDVGGNIDPNSYFTPSIASDGLYKVLEINVDADSRGSPWYMDMRLLSLGDISAGKVPPNLQLAAGGG